MSRRIKIVSTVILVVLLTITMVACSPKTELEQEVEYTEEQRVFLQELEIIKQVEDVANSYVNENSLEIEPSLLALTYIRSIRYYTRTWNIVAGTIDSKFVEYIEQKMPEIRGKLTAIDTLTDAFTNEKYDFIHLCATLNASIYSDNRSSRDLTGWAGDIVQFVAAIHDGSEKLEDFATEKGGLNRPDLIADIDAVNIYKMYMSSTNKSIYSVMCKYYSSLLNENRNELFVNYLGLNNKNKDERVEYIYNRMKLNSFLAVLNETYNISYITDEQLFKDVIEVFVDYFM